MLVFARPLPSVVAFSLFFLFFSVHDDLVAAVPEHLVAYTAAAFGVGALPCQRKLCERVIVCCVDNSFLGDEEGEMLPVFTWW